MKTTTRSILLGFALAVGVLALLAAVPSQTDFDGTYFKTNTLPISLVGNLVNWQQRATNTFSSHWVDSGTSDATLAGSAYISQTNFVNELVSSNGITLGGVRQTTWPSGGNITNTGASVIGMFPTYTDTSGTQVTPTNTVPSLIVGSLSLSNLAANVVPVFDGSTNMVPSRTTTNQLDMLYGLTGSIVTTTSATTLTNKTYDAAGDGNTLKMRGYIVLTHPHVCDGTGAIIQTNDYTKGYYGQAKFSNSGATNANWICYRLTVPEDIDTSVDLKVERWKFRLSAADTGSHSYSIGMASIADSASVAATTISPGYWVNLSFAGDASGAQDDGETVSNVTLTNWKSNVTAGQFWVIRVARDGPGTNAADSSTVDSYSGPLVISYGIAQ